MNGTTRKNQFVLKFRMNKTRNGSSLKLFTADGNQKAFKQSGIVVDGITDLDALRRAVRTQLEWIAEEIVGNFIGDIIDSKQRAETIRIKERDNMRRKRRLTLNGGGKPANEASDANL